MYKLFHLKEMFSALVLSWEVGVMRMALHSGHAQQTYCFGNFRRERGFVITWFTPTLFTPLSIGSYWTELIGKKKVQLALSFWIRVWIIRVGKSELETFSSHCYVSIGNHVSSQFLILSLRWFFERLHYDYVPGNLLQWKVTPMLTFF